MLNRLIFIAALLLAISPASAQCDRIYRYPQTWPEYPGSDSARHHFISHQLVPAISKYMKETGDIVTSVMMLLTINKKGKVIEVSFTRKNLTDSCQKVIRNVMLKMNNWKPAVHDGKAVCSVIEFPILCLLWQED